MRRALVLVALLPLVGGCPGSSLTTCGAEPDITGHWTLTLTPLATHDSIPRGDTVEADLTQHPRPNSTLGSLIWGTLVSSDKGFFDTLVIPELVMNNGGKTGGSVVCTLKINIPVATMVTDDNRDQGPLRLALSGSITARGMMTGDTSNLIRVDNPDMLPETFTWSGKQR
jgi:hypothetical protein